MKYLDGLMTQEAHSNATAAALADTTWSAADFFCDGVKQRLPATRTSLVDSR
jgi:hypothetical protein